MFIPPITYSFYKHSLKTYYVVHNLLVPRITSIFIRLSHVLKKQRIRIKNKVNNIHTTWIHREEHTNKEIIHFPGEKRVNEDYSEGSIFEPNLKIQEKSKHVSLKPSHTHNNNTMMVYIPPSASVIMSNHLRTSRQCLKIAPHISIHIETQET